jgi:hypothetical protein
METPFAGDPKQLVMLHPFVAPSTYYSGNKIPFITFTVVDIFNTIVQPAELNFDLFVVSLESHNATALTSEGMVVPSLQIPFMPGMSRIEIQGVALVADPGNYILVLYSVINYLNATRFSQKFNLTVNTCPEPNVNITYANELYPRCIERE